jgi:hypothetical protein
LQSIARPLHARAASRRVVARSTCASLSDGVERAGCTRSCAAYRRCRCCCLHQLVSAAADLPRRRSKQQQLTAAAAIAAAVTAAATAFFAAAMAAAVSLTAPRSRGAGEVVRGVPIRDDIDRTHPGNGRTSAVRPPPSHPPASPPSRACAGPPHRGPPVSSPVERRPCKAALVSSVHDARRPAACLSRRAALSITVRP